MPGGFAGKHDHGLDPKGRCIIPAPFREKLGSCFTIAFNSNLSALAIYPLEKWNAINDQLGKIHDTDDEAMDYMRLILANAQTDLDMDAQGRILLPAHLRDAVGLEKDVTFVGMLDHVEVWDKETYAERERDMRANFTKNKKHVNDTYNAR